MSLSGSLAAVVQGNDDDPMRTLWEYPEHVFIFTRAGKPVFSLHGGEERMSPLFALLQVLLHMGDASDDDSADNDDVPHTSQPSSRQASSSSARDATTSDEVRQAVYYQPCPDPAQGGEHEVQALTLFFYVQGELMYVMAQRAVAPASPARHEDANDAEEGCPYACTTPPVASYCAAQLRHLHHFILLVLPTINSLLEQQPSLDVMCIYTDSDRAALRELIESYASRLTYAVGAMATLTLSVEKRRIVEGALLRSFRFTDDVAAPPAQQLFSLLFYQDYLVAAVGPPETYAMSPGEADRAAPLAFGPADACCGGLHVDDALLLYRFARSLVRRQVGEAWAPVCLPRFNNAGYLWCYAVDFSRYIRDLRGELGLSVWPSLWPAKGDQNLLLLHVSAGQDDFTPLSRCTRRFAQLLYAPAVSDNFYHKLEEEICYRTPALLTELLGPLHASYCPIGSHGASNASPPSRSPSPLPSTSSSSRCAGVPLWYGLVVQGGDPDFLTSDEMAEPHATTEAAAAVAAAAMRAVPHATADVRLFFECQPSPLLNLTTVDAVKEFHQCVVRYQAQLRSMPASSSSPSMLLVRHSSSVAFALVHPTVSTLTTLAQHFFSTWAPLGIPDDVDEVEVADGNADPSFAGDRATALHSQRRGSDSNEEPQHLSRRGVSFSAWLEAVRALGVAELAVVFPAATPDALAWYWVARVLFMAVQRRRRYVVRQLVGKQPQKSAVKV
ncbi:hypothetical protein ABB37_03191 [Leptomonas pyrrhocoris]|uniref:FUZ/MON1/HPS1 second Longin domain-containing protein n=1 Tax=Leptomonas pyrrhocoris TaxID=157538 RepID=A0A0N0DWM9_LEPPY|nr:hypothetical protein ABB37_03191 [Leptomonas pyrrhocoris]KPA82015.1 hypothetical protein ABB37_03191 [Leptomonas pyrrhocoris]|eukprot:XP_015660454.1 hypothetical protein ABB37_03191 [Leptomonas pyrrhocoris]